MTAASTDDSGNGRVTIALLGQKVDGLSSRVDKLLDKFDEHLKDSTARDTAIALLSLREEQDCENYKDLKKEVDSLKKRSYALDGVNAALAVLAGILGFSNR